MCSIICFILITSFKFLFLQNRYDIYINEKVPSNDGGIALGQMAVALTRYLQENDIEIVK